MSDGTSAAASEAGVYVRAEMIERNHPVMARVYGWL